MREAPELNPSYGGQPCSPPLSRTAGENIQDGRAGNEEQSHRGQEKECNGRQSGHHFLLECKWTTDLPLTYQQSSLGDKGLRADKSAWCASNPVLLGKRRSQMHR